MECRVVITSLSDYLDSRASQNTWLSESEIRAVEDHLIDCLNCQSVKIELTEIRIAARELPLHTPSHALWMRISNVIEAEVAPSQRPTREEFPAQSFWDRLKSRRLSFSLPQLAGAAALGLVLMASGIFYSRSNSNSLSFSDAQTALLPEEPEIKADLNRRIATIESRKAQWHPQMRAEFDQHIARIEESLKQCRQNLQSHPQDAIQQQNVRALYNEKRQLLEDVERLKW